MVFRVHLWVSSPFNPVGSHSVRVTASLIEGLLAMAAWPCENRDRVTLNILWKPLNYKGVEPWFQVLISNVGHRLASFIRSHFFRSSEWECRCSKIWIRILWIWSSKHTNFCIRFNYHTPRIGVNRIRPHINLNFCLLLWQRYK